MFHYHTKLHYSQTMLSILIYFDEFHYHTKLHYSQTKVEFSELNLKFHYHTVSVK